MTYIHITIEELLMIEAYFQKEVHVSKIATFIDRSCQTIHNIVTFLPKGQTAIDYFKQYKEKNKRCGRRPITLPNNQQKYIQKMVAQR